MTCCKSSSAGNFTYLSKIFSAIAVQTSWMHLCTVDFPTPNRLAMVRYSAEEAIQYTAMATLWFSWSGSRTDLKLGRKSSHKISKVAFVIRKFSIHWSSLNVPFTISVHHSRDRCFYEIVFSWDSPRPTQYTNNMAVVASVFQLIVCTWLLSKYNWSGVTFKILMWTLLACERRLNILLLMCVYLLHIAKYLQV